MKTNLSSDNFFVVNNLTLNKSEEIKGAVGNYLAENFEKLMKKDGFNNLEKDEIVSLFQSPNIKYSSEKTKWFAALKWTKYDQRHRKKVFSELFKTIKLELLPSDFIYKDVLNETLVKESHECKDLILHSVFAHGESRNTDQTIFLHLACLDRDNGNIKALNLATNQWKNLPSVNLSERPIPTFGKQRQIINVCNEIYCLNFEGMLKFDENGMKWIQRQSRSKQPSEYMEVAVVQKHIYVVDCDVMACYDVVGDSWKENLPGCGLGGQFCAASSDKFIYTMGGYNNERLLADAKQFDLVTQSYSQITDMRTARGGATAAVFHEQVFVVGGNNGKEYLNSVEIYQPLTKTWTESMASTCVRHWLLSACVANNALYIVGGDRDEGGLPLNPRSVEVFDEVQMSLKW